WGRVKIFCSQNRKIFILMLVYFTFFLVVSTIMLMLLTRPEGEVKIPDVTGKKFTAVYGGLVRKDLKPVVKFFDAFDIEDGVILRQYPEPGSVVSEGDRIELTVSRNDLEVDVPSLAGKELPVAKNMLKNLHIGERTVSLGVGVVSYIPSEKSADNIVLDQSPKPGEKVTPETRINILVSAGAVAPDLKMPDLSGQSIDLCFDLLLSKGVFVEQDVVSALTAGENGRITAQEPAKDTVLAAGQTVKVKVAYFTKEEHYYNGYEKVSYQIPDDEKEGLYEAYIEDYNPKRICYSAHLKPGQTMQFVFQRAGNARVTVMRNKKSMKVMRIDVEDF
ncbi:MAG: PASTA domain-containing protein, partial [Spirochaetota bacterium]